MFIGTPQANISYSPPCGEGSGIQWKKNSSTAANTQLERTVLYVRGAIAIASLNGKHPPLQYSFSAFKDSVSTLTSFTHIQQGIPRRFDKESDSNWFRLPVNQLCNRCKWCHIVTKFGTKTTDVIWRPNLQLMQLAPSGDQIWSNSTQLALSWRASGDRQISLSASTERAFPNFLRQ